MRKPCGAAVNILQTLTMTNDKLKLLAKDLTKEFPRSPRETLAGYVLAARCIDKCRAVVNGTAGEYHFDCPLDRMWLSFANLNADQLKDFVATGATDGEIAQWITEHAQKRPRIEIVLWNNQKRDARLSEMPPQIQEYMEDYVPKFVPRNRPVYRLFDVFDLEEKRF
jgi:hypothetical protein